MCKNSVATMISKIKKTRTATSISSEAQRCIENKQKITLTFRVFAYKSEVSSEIMSKAYCYRSTRYFVKFLDLF